jgi:hypothetical protein
MTIAGQVIASDTVSYMMPENRFCMIANAYPVALNPNVHFTITSGTLTSDDDQIQVANVNPETGIINFDIYTYYDYDPNWGGAANPEGWYDIEFNKVNTAIIPVGVGFWLKTMDSVTFEVASPL